MADEPELTLVTMVFEASDPAGLVAVLAKYVVLTRMETGCSNVDLCASVTGPNRFVVIEKWASAAALRTHVDAAVLVEMAQACAGLLTGPPEIDLLEGMSAHDLR